MRDTEELYREYSTQVYKFIFSFCHNHLLAEEITQETFYRAIKSIHRYDGSCKVYVWLCQIAKHLWYREYKRMRGEISKSIEDISDNLPSNENIERDIVASESKVEIFQMIQTLNKDTREVMYLRLTGELSFREIGEILGRNETWARVTFYRGKQKLVKEGLK